MAKAEETSGTSLAPKLGLSGEIECFSCCENMDTNLKRPISLPCFHILCAQCLDDLTENGVHECPQCGRYYDPMYLRVIESSILLPYLHSLAPESLESVHTLDKEETLSHFKSAISAKIDSFGRTCKNEMDAIADPLKVEISESLESLRRMQEEIASIGMPGLYVAIAANQFMIGQVDNELGIEQEGRETEEKAQGKSKIGSQPRKSGGAVQPQKSKDGQAKPAKGQPQNPGKGQPQNPGKGQPRSVGKGLPRNAGKGQPRNSRRAQQNSSGAQAQQNSSGAQAQQNSSGAQQKKTTEAEKVDSDGASLEEAFAKVLKPACLVEKKMHSSRDPGVLNSGVESKEATDRFVAAGTNWKENIAPRVRPKSHDVLIAMLRRDATEGKVFAIQKLNGGMRSAKITLWKDKLLLHRLRKKAPAVGSLLYNHFDVIKLVDPSARLAFLDICEDFMLNFGKVIIRLNGNTNGAKQFAYMCTGEIGPSYAGATAVGVFNRKDDNLKFIRMGDKQCSDGTHGTGLVPGLMTEGRAEYIRPWLAGTIEGGWIWDKSLSTQFDVLMKDNPGRMCESAFGIVEEGLDLLNEAVTSNLSVPEWVIIRDCGLILA